MIFHVESGLFDDGMKPVGRFVLAGCWSREDARVALRAQLVEARLNFEPMERVTRIEDESLIAMLPTAATRTWSIETSRGNSYSGVSVSQGALPANAKARIVRLTCIQPGRAHEGRFELALTVSD